MTILRCVKSPEERRSHIAAEARYHAQPTSVYELDIISAELIKIVFLVHILCLNSFFSFLYCNEYVSVSTKWPVSISLFPFTYELHVPPRKIPNYLKIRLVSPKKAQEVPSLSYPVSALCCMEKTELGHPTRH